MTNERLAAALADRYRFERELGKGGMATVYLAVDLKHRRKVAIKVLLEDLSASVGASRFLREIEIAAQLQHPNILPLLDSGEAAGLFYYVMPFVEGQSLRQRLARERELPIGEAVRLLIEIVDALAYAHQRGVVHRDIKPDNVMLTGRHALVADFGVAKAVSEATGSNTLTSMGVALGTPTYMAPEQAMADPHVDQRADLYAVGVVAYELLAGRPPFTGITPRQMLAMHVTEKPDPLSRHRPGVSPQLEQAVMRCLEKLPADRWQSADDLLHALEPLATPSGGTQPTAARLPALAQRPRIALRSVALGVLVSVAAAAVGFRVLNRPAALYSLGRSNPVTSTQGLEITPTISPDGKFVAYAAGNSAQMRIFVRPVAGGRTIPLSDDSTSIETLPRWSPDGSQLLYLTRGGVSVAPAFGAAGSVRVVVPGRASGPLTLSADWSPSGKEVAFVRTDSLLVTSLEGSTPRLVASATGMATCVWSPDGNWFACSRGNTLALIPGSKFGNLAPSEIGLIPAAGGGWIGLTEASNQNQSPAWSPDSRRVFYVSNRDGPRDIYAQAVTSSGAPSGAPARLSTGLGVQSIGLSSDGKTLTYSVYQTRASIWSLPIPSRPPAGLEGAIQLTFGNELIEGLAVSRDGRWLVYDSNLLGNSDIYRIPTGGGAAERLTSEPFDEFSPDLSPDGRAIVYHAFRTPGLRQIEVKPLDGGPVERITTTASSGVTRHGSQMGMPSPSTSWWGGPAWRWRAGRGRDSGRRRGGWGETASSNPRRTASWSPSWDCCGTGLSASDRSRPTLARCTSCTYRRSGGRAVSPGSRKRSSIGAWMASGSSSRVMMRPAALRSGRSPRPAAGPPC